jgi:hypothetical protein
MNIFGAAAAAAALFETKLRLELAGHHEARPSGLTDIRLSDPFAQTNVHVSIASTIMRSILSMPLPKHLVKPTSEGQG